MVKRPGSKARAVYDEVRKLTAFLVEKSWADGFNFPALTPGKGGYHSVNYPGGNSGASYLGDQYYAETYREQLGAKAYNFRLLDGALVQMSYEFDASDKLVRHRLAFLPSPDLSDFQNSPEIFIEEVLYAEVIERKVVTVPLRFDFDDRVGVARSVDHPVSHVTFGQYKNCRVPASSGVSPHAFMSFILRNFYNTALKGVEDEFPAQSLVFPVTLQAPEAALLHFGVPGGLWGMNG